MDPLPFLFLAVLVFGSVQFGAYFAWRSARTKPPLTGIGEVKASQYKAAKIPLKINRKK